MDKGFARQSIENVEEAGLRTPWTHMAERFFAYLKEGQNPRTALL